VNHEIVEDQQIAGMVMGRQPGLWDTFQSYSPLLSAFENIGIRTFLLCMFDQAALVTFACQ